MQRWTAGCFLWSIYDYEAMLHAAGAENICTDGPEVRRREVIGWVS